MRSAVVAVSLAGLAVASFAPSPEDYPSHGQPQGGYPGGDWGSEAPAVPSEAPEAPAYSEAPAAPEYSDVWTTEVKTAWETYCPKATQITHQGVTYTASESETITITNCPGGCTVSYPVSKPPAPTTPVVTYSKPAPPPVYSSPAPPPVSAPAPPPPSEAPPAPYPVGNSTTPVYSTAPVASTGSAYPSSPVPATGAASQLSAAGAAIAAIFGLVAAL